MESLLDILVEKIKKIEEYKIRIPEKIGTHKNFAIFDESVLKDIETEREFVIKMIVTDLFRPLFDSYENSKL